MPILDVAQKTCQKQWTIGKGGKSGSEISVLMARHDDDDDDDDDEWLQNKVAKDMSTYVN